MDLVTPKPLKNLDFSGYALTSVSFSLHQKHWKISPFQDAPSRGYPSRYTKRVQKSQFFSIPCDFGMHLVTPKALKNLKFSRYPCAVEYASRDTKSTQRSELFRIRAPPQWICVSLKQKHSKV